MADHVATAETEIDASRAKVWAASPDPERKEARRALWGSPKAVDPKPAAWPRCVRHRHVRHNPLGEIA